MTTRLLHYSSDPVVLQDRHYTQRITDKPHGLWVSVEGNDDWPSWCRAERYGLSGLAYELAVTLSGHILWITTPEGIDDFDRRYGVAEYGHVDWPAVVAKYDGIIIAPYQWSRRFRPSWYYSWDCASGCIWNLVL